MYKDITQFWSIGSLGNQYRHLKSLFVMGNHALHKRNVVRGITGVVIFTASSAVNRRHPHQAVLAAISAHRSPVHSQLR